MDKYFRVEVINQTNNPQLTVFSAMRQDYIEEFSYDRFKIDNSSVDIPKDLFIDGSTFFDSNKEERINETLAGELVVKHLLNGGRGHYGPLEHPQIVFNVGWFPHSTMQQIRTHRVGVSFDVQSFRYTGDRLYRIGDKLQWNEYIPGKWNWDEALKEEVEEVVYLRPEGQYSDRKGQKYYYTEQGRLNDLSFAACALAHYARNIDKGYSEEHARGLIPFDVRQHWVMSCNLRSLMHLLDLRWKADAQLECQQLSELLALHFKEWAPEIYGWYETNRAKKAKLAP